MFDDDRRNRYAGKPPAMIPVVAEDPNAPSAPPTPDSWSRFTETGRTRAPSSASLAKAQVSRRSPPGHQRPIIVTTRVPEHAPPRSSTRSGNPGDGATLDEDAASAGGIDAHIAVAPGQRQDAEASAKALLGMRSGSDDSLEKGSGKWTILCLPRSALPASTCRSGDGRRHVIGNCRVAAPVGRTGMARDPLTLVENLDCLVSDAHIDEFTDEAIRGRRRDPT